MASSIKKNDFENRNAVKQIQQDSSNVLGAKNNGYQTADVLTKNDFENRDAKKEIINDSAGVAGMKSNGYQTAQTITPAKTPTQKSETAAALAEQKAANDAKKTSTSSSKTSTSSSKTSSSNSSSKNNTYSYLKEYKAPKRDESYVNSSLSASDYTLNNNVGDQSYLQPGVTAQAYTYNKGDQSYLNSSVGAQTWNSNQSYQQSDKVNKYQNAYDQHIDKGREEWSGGTYDNQIKELADQIGNRDKFSYDLQNDMLYQQYKDQYMREGQVAMQNMMGQAAALTGGYGSSYAATAGAQAYMHSLAQLNDRIPELYQLALDKYNREGQDMYDRLSMYQGLNDSEYSKYRDRVSDYYSDASVLSERFNNERNFESNMYQYDRSQGFNEYSTMRNQDIQMDQFNRNMAQNQAQYDSDMAFNAYKYNQDTAIAQDQFDRNMAMNQAQYDRDMAYRIDSTNASNRIQMDQYDRDMAMRADQYDTSLDYQSYNDVMDRRYNYYEAQRNRKEEKRQFNESLKNDKNQFDQNYKLSEKQLAETVRHNKETENISKKNSGSGGGGSSKKNSSKSKSTSSSKKSTSSSKTSSSNKVTAKKPKNY